ncbi:MAG: thermonuclease family protein, partial [Candidatus Binatia bacterium]
PFTIGIIIGLLLYRRLEHPRKRLTALGLIALITLAFGVPWVREIFGTTPEESPPSKPPAVEVPHPIAAAPTQESTTDPSAAPEVAGVNKGEQTAKVARVIDGDTIEIETGEKVRYIGIDAPETSGECLHAEATAKNQELVEGKLIRLEKDISEVDSFGRLLRYVYIDGHMINETLVREGFADARAYPPDTQYESLLKQAELSAKVNRWGIWSEQCASIRATIVPTHTQAPASQQSPVTTPSGTCVILGNINADGEKIYHLPGCGSYSKTKIEPEKGERVFCTESEAAAAGWRKALNC